MSLDVVLEILKLGLPGLVFLFSFLAFRLLAREQDRERPRTQVLAQIKTFMGLNLVFALLTFGSPLAEYFFTPASFDEFSTKARMGATDLKKGWAAVCTSSDYLNHYLLVQEKGDPQKMIQVFAGSPIPCESPLQHIALNPEDLDKLGWQEDQGDLEVQVATPPFEYLKFEPS